MNFNRRKFLYYTSLAGIGLSINGCNTQGEHHEIQRASVNPKGKIGVALVGLGYYSRDLLAPALQLTKHCYLAGIVTGSPEKIPVWQKKYDIKDSNVYNYDNMHTIADNDEIDVIYIVLPTGLHAKYGIIAANTGKHVWCEKPMAMNVEECQSIIDACHKNKVKLSVGYRMQHEPNTQTLIEYGKTKPYGAIEKVTSVAGYSGGIGKGWRFQKALGGGALYDMGVYTINGIRYATNMEPIRVLSAKHSTNRPQYFTEVDETTEYKLEFANGLIANGKTSVGATFNQLRVDCEKGWYELSPMQSYNGVQGKTSDGFLLNKPIKNQQAKQMDDDALAIINNTPVLVPASEGLKDIQIVNAIQEAAKKGVSVKIMG
ncbi:MAG: Gfo/Idh/MocA family oxidoreductase [Bacteroidota bacterium]